jgi:hypothetical protein
VAQIAQIDLSGAAQLHVARTEPDAQIGGYLSADVDRHEH